jgi:glycosyltransferase involved in cell wall biosynthesis
MANTAWYLYNHRISLARELKRRGVDLILLSPADEFAPILLEQGFDWRPISMTRQGLNPMIELATLFKLTRLYRQLQPDVAHHFTTKPVIYGSMAGRWASVPTIINAITGLGYLFAREGVFGKMLRLLAGLLYRLSLRGPSIKVIFQNQNDRTLFVDSGWARADQTFLIPGSGVDTEQFSSVEEPDSVPIVLLVGRMLWDKGVSEFVEAARMLKARGVEAEFRLVGGTDPGNPAAIPESMLKQWSQEGTIQWLGQQNNMSEVYANSSVVALPSNYREGVPRTLIEAAAVGRPLVASDIPGCRDIVKDGINGFLVPPKDAVQLAAAIEELLENPGLRRRMGQAGREMVMEKYSDEKILQATLALYPDLEEAKSSKVQD